jgi:hypothetical protein
MCRLTSWRGSWWAGVYGLATGSRLPFDRAVDGYVGLSAVLKLHAACYRRQIISQAIASAPDLMAARHYPRAACTRHPPPPCPARRHGTAPARAPVP